jgi:hypothetical protein
VDVKGPRYPEIHVQLESFRGNPWATLGAVSAEMVRSGAPESDIQEFVRDASGGTYDHMVETARAWVTVDDAGWKTVCAWCGKHLSGEPGAPNVSHGICDTCASSLEEGEA